MKQFFVFMFVGSVLTSCSPSAFDEEKDLISLRAALSKAFSLHLPEGRDVTTYAARQRISPREFAVIKIEFRDLALLESFRAEVQKLDEYGDRLEEAYFSWKLDGQYDWWDVASVVRERRYFLKSESKAGNIRNVSIHFPEPATGSVYLEIGGNDWEDR